MTAVLSLAVVALLALSGWLLVRGGRDRRRAVLFDKAFTATPTPIVISTFDTGRFLAVNPSFEAMVQFSRDELLGRTSLELGLWGSPTDRQAILASVTAEGRLRDRPVILRRRDGELRRVLMSIERVELDGKPALLSMARDVTAQMRAEQDERRLDAQIQEARRLEAIGQLAGGIAHDFNNVLQAVKGYAELAVESLGPDHSALAPLAQVSEAADRAALFTAQLLTFSRRDALPQTAALNLTQIATQTGELLRRSLGGHIQVNVDAREHPIVEGDRGQLEQVLINLCLNARDAMPNGGAITIAVGRTRFEADALRDRPWARQGRWACLAVTDEGTGIAENVRPRIFEPFFTTKPAGRGAGLGLSTVYAISERHRGFVGVETATGKGSTFTVYFPDAGTAEAPQTDARGGAARRATEAVAGALILLAEDEPFVRDLAVEMLEGAGYRVLVARDGAEAEAIVTARGGEIRAAVLDVVMPVRNGRQVFESLQRAHPGVPAVFCTGYSFGELSDVEKHARTVVLPKPYSRASLLAAVADALDLRRQIPTA